MFLFVFVLAHVQSQTECGFHINKAMLVEILEETSINGQRHQRMIILYDQMGSKKSLFTNLLLAKNLHYPASLHTVNIRLLQKVPEQTP